MEIKSTTNLQFEIIDTVSVIEQPIMFCLENKEEMGHFTIKLVYEDRNGENWLSYFTIEDEKTKIDREDIATELFKYIERESKKSYPNMKIPFEVTEEHHNYIDNAIDDVIKEFKIYEEES